VDIGHDIFQPVWWRFTKYEISDDGFCIRPAAGAELKTYDPRDAYKKRGRAKDVVPPYQSLINLLARATDRPSSRSRLLTLKPSGEEEILQWCSTHGLLGVLPQMAQSAFLAPRVELTPKFPPPTLYQKSFAAQRSFSRRAGEWMLSFDNYEERYDDDGDDDGWVWNLPLEAAGQLLPQEKCKIFHEPGVMMEDLESGEQRWESFGPTWSRFFPDVPKEEIETYNYPPFLAEEFWHQYAEPVEKFVGAAQLLHSALTDIKEGRPDGLLILKRLVSPIGVTFEKARGGGLEQRWISPSLLATYAMMACLDLKARWRLFRCKRKDCRLLFASRAYQAAYCTETCRNTVHKRKWRKQKERSGTKATSKRPQTNRTQQSGYPTQNVGNDYGKEARTK
jgi:hypothetical protein